jgi:hypothetical protein
MVAWGGEEILTTLRLTLRTFSDLLDHCRKLERAPDEDGLIGT